MVGALTGAREHAVKHAQAGVDILVAAGGEAGGHCGEIATMVLIPEVLEAIESYKDIYVLAAGGQLVVIGSGDAEIENAFRAAARAHPASVSVYLGFDDALSHRIMAGADILLVPSRFEPCGLTQLYALRYGTIPLVRRVGGLADTVVDATPEHLRAGTANGFVFDHASSRVLAARIGDALKLMRHAAAWQQLQKRGMAQDFSWADSALRYEALYRSI